MKLRTYGERALFTRPETLAEPCSYPAITPTAIKGLLENIFWKPEMRYKVKSVMVLKPIQFRTTMINSIKEKVTDAHLKTGFVASEHRTQRNYTYLVDVEYIIDFDVETKAHADAPLSKYIDQITCRIDKGQCFRQPFFGVKEHVAYFEWATGEETPHESLKYLQIDMGYMPLEIDRTDNKHRDLIHAVINGGVIDYATTY
jgi:CRISPR-associated protein Cas5d